MSRRENAQSTLRGSNNTRLRCGVGFDVDVLNQSASSAPFASLDVLVFPELMDGGYAALKSGKPPHSFRDDFLSRIRQCSRDCSATLIAGSIFLKHDSRRPTNTSLVFRRGTLLHRYDKIHLFKPAGDDIFFEHGKLEATTFSLQTQPREVRAGVVICYDVRFPELVRSLALQGMTVLFVPARWPKARDEAWQSLLKARAIENQIFVVGCNANDDEGGYSYAFNPMGKMIFSNRSNRKKQMQKFEIDLRDIDTAKKSHRNLDDAVFLRKVF
jgi:omega-amidase